MGDLVESFSLTSQWALDYHTQQLCRPDDKWADELINLIVGFLKKYAEYAKKTSLSQERKLCWQVFASVCKQDKVIGLGLG
jgi:hypothetical protein